MWLATCVAYCFILGVESLDFRLDPILEIPGFYYEQLGEARLSNSEWKISSYADWRKLTSILMLSNGMLNLQ